jgi:hypothetical protein
MRERGAAFLEEIEGWITEHEDPDAPQTVRAGVMLQMFVEDRSETDESPSDLRET